MFELLEFLFNNPFHVNIAIAPIVAAGLIAGGGALLGGAMNYAGMRGANKANVEQSQAQREFDLMMWKKNNRYNSPVNQMARLQEAGLNPNLMYGGGSASTGLSSSYPKASVPHMENTLGSLGDGLSSATSAYFDIMLKQAQINAVNNNADLTAQKTINEGFKKSMMESLIAKNQWEVQKGKSLLPYQQSMFEGNINKTLLFNKDLLWKLKDRNPAEIASIMAKVANTNASTANLNFDRNWLMPKKSALMNLDIGLKKQSLNDLNVSLLELRKLQKNIMELDYNFNKGLMPYNVTGKDNILFRLIPGIFNTNNDRKDKLITW